MGIDRRGFLALCAGAAAVVGCGESHEQVEMIVSEERIGTVLLMEAKSPPPKPNTYVRRENFPQIAREWAQEHGMELAHEVRETPYRPVGAVIVRPLAGKADVKDHAPVEKLTDAECARVKVTYPGHDRLNAMTAAEQALRDAACPEDAATLANVRSGIRQLQANALSTEFSLANEEGAAPDMRLLLRALASQQEHMPDMELRDIRINRRTLPGMSSFNTKNDRYFLRATFARKKKEGAAPEKKEK